MSDRLDPVIYFIGSGNAFFCGGAALLLAALVLTFLPARPWLQLTCNLGVLIGSILVAISATPLAWWLYVLLTAATALWIVAEWRKPGRVVIAARMVMAGAWILAMALELPYHFMPRLPALGNPPLFLIGDSVSAGTREAEAGTWPKLLAKTHGADVRDFSKMGATVGSARKQAERIGDEAGLVVLEIGGNDLLGSTTADQFEERLNQLLANVCRHDRTVVMLELPLPPFANRLGLAQRCLAEKYGVLLIPKRVFIGVLTTRGATIDGIHLSPTGHAQMAEAIWQAVEGAYAKQ